MPRDRRAEMQTDAIRLTFEPPEGVAGRACRDAYFDELARRFETGFDPGLGKAGSDQDMAPPTGAFLVARTESEVVGCGGFRRLDATTAEIKRMWIAPTARGQGLARRLLREIERLAREAGYAEIRLDTNRALAEARTLYRREGYREIARYNDNPYADHWFGKPLV